MTANFSTQRRKGARARWYSRVRLAACPVCQPDLFDGGLARVPVPLPCMAHAGHPALVGFVEPGRCRGRGVTAENAENA